MPFLNDAQKSTPRSDFHKAIYAIRGIGSTKGMACAVDFEGQVPGQLRQDNRTGSVCLVTWNGCVVEHESVKLDRYSKTHMGNYQLKISNMIKTKDFSFLLVNGKEKDCPKSLYVRYLTNEEQMADLTAYTISVSKGLEKLTLQYNHNTKKHDVIIPKERYDFSLHGSPIIMNEEYFVGILKENDAGEPIPFFIAKEEFVDLPHQAENLKPVSSTVSPGWNLESLDGTVLQGQNSKPVSGTVSPGQNSKPVSGTVSPRWKLEPVSGTVSPGQNSKPASGTVSPGQNLEPVSGTVSPGQNSEPVSGTVSPGQNTEPVSGTVSPGQNTEPVSGTVSPRQNSEPVSGTVSPGQNTEPVSEKLLEHGEEARPSGGFWINLRITEFSCRSAMVVGALAGGAMAGGGMAVGGMAVGGTVSGALILFLNKNLGLVEFAIRAALVKLGCQVWRIKPCSILVDLHCNTKESFLSFLEDFETGKVKQRLDEEFKKVGYEGELEVAITNYQEVHEKLDQIRKLEQEKIKVVKGETSATVADSKEDEDASTSPVSPKEQETLSEMTAHLSLASAAPTSPALSTEQETLSGSLKHPDINEAVIMPHESSQGRGRHQESVIVKSGYILMINNYDFPQSQGYLDLYNEFKKFGFRTRRDERLTTSEMLKAVTDTAERDFSSDDCFVCVIVSHGSKDAIYGTINGTDRTDDKAINLKTIATLFSRDKCPSLYEKPKIFLIEACQRSQTDEGPDSVPLPPPVISGDEFLICRAFTSPHIKYPYKTSVHGSRKLRPIYSVAQELKSKSIVDIEMVMTSPLMQQWQPVSTLTKNVVFERKMEHIGSYCTLE